MKDSYVDKKIRKKDVNILFFLVESIILQQILVSYLNR